MFNFLKEKLKSFFKKTEDKEKVKKVVKGKSKKTEKTSKKKQKITKEKKIYKESGERLVAEKVLEDIEKQEIEISSPEQRYEEVEKELEVQKIEQEAKKLEEQEEIEKKPGFFSRIFSKITGKFKLTEEHFQEIFSELETIMLENNVALEVVENLREKLKSDLVNKEIEKNQVSEEVQKSLKSAIEGILKEPFDLFEKIKQKKPFVIAFVGINGSGKTTTIAKIAYMLKKNKLSVVLAAGDTFRAASIEQLQEHGKKLGIPVIKSQYNSDPASVAFDAIKHAEAKKIDVVLIDTAGRMHTKSSLLKEMEKIIRVSKPDLKLFIGEAITGNDATEQAKTFNETIGIDGIILSKQDVDEKGGTSLSVSYITGKPILYLGVGQEMKDLQVFSKKKLIEQLGL